MNKNAIDTLGKKLGNADQEPSTMTTQLSASQHATLAHAIHHTEGKLDWFPDNVKGGARKKVIDGLFNRALITPDGTDWMVAAEGYDALGAPRPAPARGPITVAALDTVIANAEAGQATATAKPRAREHSKQAQVIAMLKRPEGATIAQICEMTEWMSHTVRGTMAGTFKKKLGLTITSSKDQGGERVYRISD